MRRKELVQLDMSRAANSPCTCPAHHAQKADIIRCGLTTPMMHPKSCIGTTHSPRTRLAQEVHDKARCMQNLANGRKTRSYPTCSIFSFASSSACALFQFKLRRSTSVPLRPSHPDQRAYTPFGMSSMYSSSSSSSNAGAASSTSKRTPGWKKRLVRRALKRLEETTNRWAS